MSISKGHGLIFDMLNRLSCLLLASRKGAWKPGPVAMCWRLITPAVMQNNLASGDSHCSYSKGNGKATSSKVEKNRRDSAPSSRHGQVHARSLVVSLKLIDISKALSRSQLRTFVDVAFPFSKLPMIMCVCFDIIVKTDPGSPWQLA